MSRFLIGLGSNQGDPEDALRQAKQALTKRDGIEVLHFSSLHRTAPAGGPGEQPPFANACAVVSSELTPPQLLVDLQRVESDFGRTRTVRWGARKLDLDILLAKNFSPLRGRELDVPHPRMSFRRFVLEPASEIAADWLHPTCRWTIAALAQHVRDCRQRLAVVSTVAEFAERITRRALERCQPIGERGVANQPGSITHRQVDDERLLGEALEETWRLDRPGAVLTFVHPTQIEIAARAIEESSVGPHLIAVADDETAVAEVVGAFEATA
ncbi:MAG: 2-amino-4-hydroxy-6-hydroxymethyldihydropteridine diphosphokinase [Pirellulaceae bacterium]|jgi:2-amino-4-hydroxy-6-hydroxymethyldihydropteridine diphosphokinase|nr:2-amino-4-hydroxy-6-hydroxymethyldihydropteridine diphosphokinase [Pirellulaceae bacterium]MDP7018755.1 2-amino-4-hydroxy-6-hydroxymethyldihydropteridine diphosphokinase [Pirellulaceae bacterium]